MSAPIDGATTWLEVPEGSPFPLWNLPLGIGHDSDGRWRAWTAIGEMALDLTAVEQVGLLEATGLHGHLRPQAEVVMGLPVQVGDYVDFYSSLHHATNLGRLFRPSQLA